MCFRLWLLNIKLVILQMLVKSFERSYVFYATSQYKNGYCSFETLVIWVSDPYS
jgi:hypothetical protein